MGPDAADSRWLRISHVKPDATDMTPPFKYQNASLEFERFMVDARDLAGLATTNMAWNMVVGVLNTFRRRLTARQVLEFASVLPPVVRALFVEGWQDEAPNPTFGNAEELLAEVRSVRSEHNFSPHNAIEAVAGALRQHVDEHAFDEILARLPPGSTSFWSGPPR